MGHDLPASVIQVLSGISVQLAALTAMIWVVCRFVRRSPASVRHVLWLLVLIKVFMLPSLHLPSPVTLWQRIAPPSHVAISSSAPAAAIARSTTSAQVLNSANLEYQQLATAVTTGTYASRKALFIIWIIGVFCLSCLLVTRSRRQSMLVRRLLPLDQEMNDLLMECALHVHPRRQPKGGYSRDVSTPMLIGILHPVVVLPVNIWESCSETDLRAMFLHELAHMKRYDMLGVWLYQITQILLFFHPAIWLTGREMDRERELACDEFVLSLSAITRKEYAAGYLSAVKLASGFARTPAALAMAEPLEMEERRLKQMLYGAIPNFSPRWWIVLLLIALVGLPTFNALSPATAGKLLQTGHRTEITKEAAIEIGRAFWASRRIKVESVLYVKKTTAKTPIGTARTLRPAWEVFFKAQYDGETITVWVDAENGNILDTARLMQGPD